MTSHLDSHRTTDIKPDLLSGVQTGNGSPNDTYDIRGTARVRTNRKYNIFMQRQMQIDKAHTALYIFHFAAFLFFTAPCMVLFYVPRRSILLLAGLCLLWTLLLIGKCSRNSHLCVMIEYLWWGNSKINIMARHRVTHVHQILWRGIQAHTITNKSGLKL